MQGSETTRSRFLLASVTIAFAAVPLFGGETPPWVMFVDETATRIDTSQDANSGPSVVQTNVDEKDYVWGDVDNDGDIDLIGVYKQIGTTTGKRRNVLLMNESGVLVDRTTQYASASAVTLEDGPTSQGFLDLTNDRDVALVDVNGDDWLDVVTATTMSGGEGGTIGDKSVSHPRVYINLGDEPPGSWNWQGFMFDDVDRVPTMPAEPRFLSVSFGDIDDDGDEDLYFTDHDQGGVRPVDLNDRLWINNGAGYYTDETALRMTAQMSESSFGHSSVMADVNGDSAIDIVKVNHLTGPDGVFIIYNDPTNEGIFSTLESIYSIDPTFAAVGNLNQDPFPDVVITDEGFDSYLLGTGNGADGLADFAPSAVLGGSAQFEFGGSNHVADLNNDGLNDVLVAGVNADVPSCFISSKLFRNFGLEPDGFSITIAQDGNAGIAQSHLNGVHDFATVDINGDNWLDLVIGNCAGTKVYINQPPVPCSLLGDMNGDGVHDGRDIALFADCFFTAGAACSCADLDPNEVMDSKDVIAFVAQLLAVP